MRLLQEYPLPMSSASGARAASAPAGAAGVYAWLAVVVLAGIVTWLALGATVWAVAAAIG